MKERLIELFNHVQAIWDFQILIIDNQPVDLLFALLVPEESTEEHLQILARLAAMFSDADLCRKLRECSDSQQCLESIDHWDARQQLSA